MATASSGAHAGLGDPPLVGYNYYSHSQANEKKKKKTELEELKKGSSPDNLYDNEFDY